MRGRTGNSLREPYYAKNGEYKEIAPELLEQTKENCWSVECMEGHGAGDRSITYIGSRVSENYGNDPKGGRMVYDYYQDSEGDFWHKTRMLLPDGEIVSMEFYIFGKEREELRRAQWRRK